MEEVSAVYFYRAGGVEMHDVGLVAAILVVAAAWFVLEPDARKLRLRRALSVATALAVVLAIASYASGWPRALLIGLFESSPLLMRVLDGSALACGCVG
jgi:hypothetical protein